MIGKKVNNRVLTTNYFAMLVYMTLLLRILLLPLADFADDGKERGGDSTEKSEWIHVKRHKDVNLYERLVKVNALLVWERKGELVVACDFDAVSEFLSAPENMKLWMKGVKEVKCLKTESRSKWTVHTIYRLPWPFENKRMISNYEYESYGTEKCLVQIKSIDTMSEEETGKERIRHFRANWLVTKIDEGRTKVVFQVICATPPMFPRWIQDPIVKRMFMKNMIRMKKQLTKLSKQGTVKDSERGIYAGAKP